MIGAAGQVIREVEVKEEEDLEIEVVDLTKLTAQPKLGLQVAEVMRKMREVMYPICLLQSVNSRDHVDEHKPTHRESLFDSVNLVLSDPPYNFRSGYHDVISH